MGVRGCTSCHIVIAASVRGVLVIHDTYTYADGGLADCVPEVAMADAVQLALYGVNECVRMRGGRIL
jgi:hypothetical protein